MTYKTWEITSVDGGFLAVHPYDETNNMWFLSFDEAKDYIDEVECL